VEKKTSLATPSGRTRSAHVVISAVASHGTSTPSRLTTRLLPRSVTSVVLEDTTTSNGAVAAGLRASAAFVPPMTLMSRTTWFAAEASTRSSKLAVLSPPGIVTVVAPPASVAAPSATCTRTTVSFLLDTG
jgi:hypothetical protein